MPSLIPFAEALSDLARRQVMPTSLDSAGLKQLGAAWHRQNFTSAQTLLTDLLDDYKEKVEKILNPVDVVRDGTTVQEGLDLATARVEIRELQRQLGYSPTPGEEGTIKDLSSDRRIDLVVKTNQQISQGAGDFIRQNDEDVIDLFPALELYRLEAREKERDWEQRWRIGCQVAADAKALAALELHGRMVALKSSGVWQALGDGAGGYTDTLGNPFAPFAFGSGMWTREVDREDAESLGVIEPGEKAQTADLDLAGLFSRTTTD